MLLGQFLEGLIMSFEVADEGAVGFDDDVVLVAVLYDCSLLAPRVKLEET